MTKWIVLAVVLAAFALPAWSIGVDYDGSVDPTTVGWGLQEGALQGSVVDIVSEPGNKAWFIDDASNKKTKFMWGLPTGTGTGDIDPGVGAYIEGRIKSVAHTGSDTDSPYNLGMYIHSSTGHAAGHMLTVRPDRLLMSNQQGSPAAYMGDFTDYHVYRLVYKLAYLPIRNVEQNTWAVYMDGAETPVLHAKNVSPTSKGYCSPLWGAGNTGTTQQVYFDYVSYRDTGAFPPGMDGSVQFVDGDPDGQVTADNLAFTISWKTNVPSVGTIYYSPVGDNSFSTVFADPDPTPKTSHSVTVAGVTPGQNYDYYVVSTAPDGEKAISLPTSISLPSPFLITTDPACTVSPDLTSVTISWTTSLGDATSELHYGTDASCSTVVAEPGGGGKTSHSITVPASSGVKYFYYVVSTHASWPTVQSSVRNFYVTGTSLINAGFEEGTLDPWVKFGRFDGLFSHGAWAVPSYSGGAWAGSAANYDNKDNGGVCQTVVTVPNTFYEAKVRIWCYRTSAALDIIGCRIGIDPTGGTNPASDAIVWSNFTDTANANVGSGGPWTEIGIAAKATGNRATVFLQQRQLHPIVWNITGFDAASWGVAPPPPSTIALTRQLNDAYPASLQGKVISGYFSHPDTYETFCYIEEPDRSAGIKVVLPDFGVVTPGDVANVEGTVQTINGEKVIIASSVDSTTPPNPSLPAPFNMLNKTVVSSFEKKAAQCQGLRVKTTGRVTYSFSFLNMMYVDDGSNANDGTMQDITGVRVYCNPLDMMDTLGKYIAVTGCLGTYLNVPVEGDPFAVPVIWCDNFQILQD